MGNINVYVSDDLTVNVDYEIHNGRPIVVKIYPSTKLEKYVQKELDYNADVLIEEEIDGATEAREDERNGR
jgi:hypothetical protein